MPAETFLIELLLHKHNAEQTEEISSLLFQDYLFCTVTIS